ncbi:MAG TPA: hypothetical protein VM537_03820 [Anaerolineae bacterium]|nr:hypothetical protein [Anaerolineae bacterium]
MNLPQILTVVVSVASLILAAISILALVFKGGQLAESVKNLYKTTDALWHAIEQKVDEKVCQAKHQISRE